MLAFSGSSSLLILWARWNSLWPTPANAHKSVKGCVMNFWNFWRPDSVSNSIWWLSQIEFAWPVVHAIRKLGIDLIWVSSQTTRYYKLVIQIENVLIEQWYLIRFFFASLLQILSRHFKLIAGFQCHLDFSFLFFS